MNKLKDILFYYVWPLGSAIITIITILYLCITFPIEMFKLIGFIAFCIFVVCVLIGTIMSIQVIKSMIVNRRNKHLSKEDDYNE